jgi:hypothetical protein
MINVPKFHMTSMFSPMLFLVWLDDIVTEPLMGQKFTEEKRKSERIFHS